CCRSLPLLSVALPLSIMVQGSLCETNMKPKTVILITYVHVIGDIFYHATISCVDGVLRSTWTYEKEGQKVTVDGRVTSDDYNYLWRIFCDEDTLRSYKITNASSKLDWINNHFFGLTTISSAGEFKHVFLLPNNRETLEPAASMIKSLKGPWTWGNEKITTT
ncbi:MAG: hypothetical protein JWO94_1916, partial [Verrucomicrobiaceae bacterium]|nr:hypothetical protein [Verrucomicrobiaceae bacterium]